MCNGEASSPWQITAAVGAMATTIVFPDAVHADVPMPREVELRETATTLTLGHFATPRFGWSATAGGIVAGSIHGVPVSVGGTAGGAVTWMPLYETTRRPFVALNAALSAAVIGLRDSSQSWTAIDVRLGATVGKTIANVLTPYASVRAFGGPVFWSWPGGRAVGSDRYHVAGGAGMTLRLPAGFAVAAEVMPLGERSASGAVTWRF